MSFQQSGVVQALDVILNGVPAAAGGFGSIINGHPAVFAGNLHNLYGQLRQVAQNQSLAFYFAFQFFLLFAQRFQKESYPGLPVRGFCPDGALGLAQREVVVLLVCFDHAFQ